MMNYQDTLNWMFSQLPMYQREGKAAYKANLDNTLALDAHFGHPHHKFKTVHVAGTNGKGSVSHMTASILQEAGYKVGLYTSPHLKDFRERIRVNGKMISEAFVIQFIENNKDFFAGIHPSFFEMTVAMAFDYFAKEKVDVAVIEVGLGGRLDSTNIITPLVSVITNISMDHMALLGNTLPAIAAEKAGIIKKGIPVVIGTRDNAYDFVFEEKAKAVNAPIYFCSDHYEAHFTAPDTMDVCIQGRIHCSDYKTQLRGLCQTQNIPTVLATVEFLQQAGMVISDENVRSGIAHVVDNTSLLGRWQTLATSPLTICDTGHNVGGIELITEQLKTCKYKKLHVVIGMVSDKDVSAVLSLLPKDAEYYFTKASIPRAMDEHLLAEKGHEAGLHGNTYPDIHTAWDAAKSKADKEDMIFIGGSTFTVAEVV